MITEIRIPDIGADEVEVTEIMVKIADHIELDQSIITVEGDKASMEIPATSAGTVKEIKVKVGDKVKTGSLIMVFDTEQAVNNATQPQTEVVATTSTTTPAESSTNNQEQIVAIPDIGNDQVEVIEIIVKVGDSINAEQSLITVEGDKASMEIPAPFAGIVKTIAVNIGDKVKTGSPIMTFITAAKQNQTVSASAPVSAPAASTVMVDAVKEATTAGSVRVESQQFVENSAYAHASPLIRRLAREFGINLAKVQGSGRKGRILREDLQSYVKTAIEKATKVDAMGGTGLPGVIPWPKVDFSQFGDTESVELNRIQKISSANLYRNWVMIPHVTQFDEVDITELEAFRKQQNQEAEKKKLGVKITPLVFILKAVAKALTVMPRFNSSLSEDAQQLILKKYINIGVAVDTPNGLVVPVLRDVNTKGIIELSQELAVLSQKARDGKLMLSEMQGGCFTISSLGGIGGTAFTPIINAPEVAILGVSKSSIKPNWNGTEFTPRLMLPLSLSYDHRVIDGADGARFITYLHSVLSDIRRLII